LILLHYGSSRWRLHLMRYTATKRRRYTEQDLAMRNGQIVHHGAVCCAPYYPPVLASSLQILKLIHKPSVTSLTSDWSAVPALVWWTDVKTLLRTSSHHPGTIKSLHCHHRHHSYHHLFAQSSLMDIDWTQTGMITKVVKILVVRYL